MPYSLLCGPFGFQKLWSQVPEVILFHCYKIVVQESSLANKPWGFKISLWRKWRNSFCSKSQCNHSQCPLVTPEWWISVQCFLTELLFEGRTWFHALITQANLPQTSLVEDSWQHVNKITDIFHYRDIPWSQELRSQHNLNWPDHQLCPSCSNCRVRYSSSAG